MAALRSQHLLGRAIDFHVPGLSPALCARYAESVPAFDGGGIGIYDGHVHVDVRLGRVRWAYRGTTPTQYKDAIVE
jgi:uncharacterized protein YcbK (DUF882 family)